MKYNTKALCGLLLAVVSAASAQNWTPPGPPEQRWALVIGNADYKDTQTWPKLPDTILQQAQEMAKTLKVLGFKVFDDRALVNQDISGMKMALSDFIDEIPPGAFVWVFYSGHGIEGSLIPVDAEAEDSFGSCCISLKEQILDPLEKRNTKASVVVINSCRSKDNNNLVGKPDPLPEPGKNIYLAFSTRSGQFANANSSYIPKLLQDMTKQTEKGQAWNVQAIFSTLNEQARTAPTPADPVTFGTIPDSVYLIPPDAPEQYIDFHEAANEAPDFVSPPGKQDVLAAPYLEKYGISIDNVTPGTHVGLMRPGVIYSGHSENGAFVMRQDGDVCNRVDSVSYTLKFSPPLKEFAFSRVRLLAESRNGITHPSWEAHAFNPEGREIAQDKFIGENLIRYIPPAPDDKGAVPEATFHMRGPYIASVTFKSSNRLNERPFAAFCSVQISSMGLMRGPVLSRGSDGQTLEAVAW